ncbi:MAG: gluconate 2-dehydrogenase subunit 3 family protein [Chitinophagaceae bacterium]|nr:gluconate 2-dehydrogenase subunit 3 family protein [Chitinophagaceae bacterium]
MDRRELIKTITLLTGAVMVGGEVFLTGCTNSTKTGLSFTPATISLLDEVAETILPATTTPGAKAAAVGAFMQVMVTDCYTKAEQEVFMTGIKSLLEKAEKMYGKSFMECSPEQKHDFLLSLEKEAKAFNEKKDAAEKQEKEIAKAARQPFTGAPPHYYTMMKQLTLWGFFTSKTGMTETLRHNPVPGSYDGAYPYIKGDKAWAE